MARISIRQTAIEQLCPDLVGQAVGRNSILQEVSQSAILVIAQSTHLREFEDLSPTRDTDDTAG
jgi:hypothetical protein